MSEFRSQLEPVWTEVGAIVGPEHIRPATADDGVDGVQPAVVASPGNAQEIAKVLYHCSSANLAVIPRGGGTKLSQGNRPEKADLVLSTERLNRVLEHAWGDMTATVEAGCTFQNVQEALKEHGQHIAADPMRPERATIGGILATAESGTFRIRYGALRDLVLGVELALADGNVIKAGGKVVKNVAGYDLTKLAIGSVGTLGVITRAVFRLHPLPVATATYSLKLASAVAAAEMALLILGSNLVYTGLQIRGDSADQFAIDVRFEGIPDSLQDQRLKLSRLAGKHEFASGGADVWAARQKLFVNAGPFMACKCSVLPAQMGMLCEAVFRSAASAGVAAKIVAQGTGLAEVLFHPGTPEPGVPGAPLDASSEQAQGTVLNELRAELHRMRGTLSVQHCPAALKRDPSTSSGQVLDVWDTPAATLPLMRRIKQKFDPARVLNPGRFVGGI